MLRRASTSSLRYGSQAAHQHQRKLHNNGLVVVVAVAAPFQFQQQCNAIIVGAIAGVVGPQHHRLLSFKAFADRNKNAPPERQQQQQPKAGNSKQPRGGGQQTKAKGGFAGIIRQNENSNNTNTIQSSQSSSQRSSQRNIPPGATETFPERHAIHANEGGHGHAARQPITGSPPWRQRQQQSQSSSHHHQRQQQQKQNGNHPKSKPPPTTINFGRGGRQQQQQNTPTNININPNRHSSAPQHHQQQQQQQQHFKDDGSDLRDISQLRNTFMKQQQQQQQSNPSNTKGRESWRRSSGSGQINTTNLAGTPSVAATNKQLDNDNANANAVGLSLGNNTNKTGIGLSGLGNNKATVVDNVTAAAGVGAKWTPSFYKKKTPPPPPASFGISSANNTNTTTTSIDSSDSNNTKSIEQVMKENAQQRKTEMENRYHNAGVRVPYNVDEYGNPIRTAAGIGGGAGAGAGAGQQQQQYGWRNNNNTHSNNHKKQGGGGGYGSFVQQNNQRGGGGGGYQTNTNQRYGNQYNTNNQRGGGKGGRHATNKNQRYNKQRQQKEKHAIRKYLPPSTPKTVKLPPTPLPLKDLSLLLRINKRTIVHTLRSLGEQMSYSDAKQDTFKIDVDMMELICMELGIEPSRLSVVTSSVEMAERRAMRLHTSAAAAATAGDNEDNGSGENEAEEDELKTKEEEIYAALPPRSPVVSIMGHVDHGKTTLMDALRRRAVTGVNTPKGSASGKASSGGGGKKSKKKGKKDKKRGKGGVNVDDGNVAGTEAGGITQVITAFEVPLPLGEEDNNDGSLSDISTVTFLDTPGHAAFKKMRQSGSSATDVIVLVVAADDGVSPQTIEIIDMYKSIARVQPQSISLVISVSKIDKPGIDIDEAVMRIENQLIEQEILTENVLAGGNGEEGEFGACQLFPVSGITGEGLDDLVEGLALQSEIMDLRADEEARGEGIVIDARMEKGLGVVADCVIRWGSVTKGDFVVSGTNGGRVKFLNDVGNKPLKRGLPSQPVRIVGFKTLPKAGDPIVCAASEDEAKEIIRLRESELFNEERAEYEKDVEIQVVGTAAKNGGMMQKKREHYGFDGEDEENTTIHIPVVIKADSHGALDAVRDALVSIGTDSKLNIVVDPVEMSTGVVTATDVMMARESDAAIFVFGKVGIADKETKQQAEGDGVEIKSYDIIYRLLEDAKDYFGKYLPVQMVDKVHGKAKVQAVFDVTDENKNSVSIAGLRLTDGNFFKEKSKPGSEGGDPLVCFFRVLRNGEVITDVDKQLTSTSLRKVKEDVDSVRNGEECGLGIKDFNDMKEGDTIECYSVFQKIADI